jgi:hypothetical protein
MPLPLLNRVVEGLVMGSGWMERDQWDALVREGSPLCAELVSNEPAHEHGSTGEGLSSRVRGHGPFAPL